MEEPAVDDSDFDSRWEESDNNSINTRSQGKLVNGSGNGMESSTGGLLTLPRLGPPPPAPPPQQEGLNQHSYRESDPRKSKLKAPSQRAQLIPSSNYALPKLSSHEKAATGSLLKLPTLIKPSRPTILAADNQREPTEEDKNGQGSRSASRGGSKGPRGAVDKHRDFIKVLEDQKRKEKEELARQESRRRKIQQKLANKILNDAAQARLKQEQDEDQEIPEDVPTTEPTNLSEGKAARGNSGERGDNEKEEEISEEEKMRKKKEKVKRQKKLLKKQQALLEQLEVKRREKQEEEELARERERKRQEKVKKTVLDLIHFRPEEVPEELVAEQSDSDQTEAPVETSVADYSEDDEAEGNATPVVNTQPGAPGSPQRHVGPPEAAAFPAAGRGIAAVRQRKEKKATAATAAATPPTDQEETAEDKQRAKEQRDAIYKKQQEYLQRLADQRRQKEQDEEDARSLQEKRKKRVQQKAQLRLQEAAARTQQQRKEEEQAQAEADEVAAAEKKVVTVDVDAMVARLSKLKEKDAQVIPEARDFASWKKRHGVRSDQKVFCMTGWYPVIRDELEKRGWFFNQERSSPFFDLKWSLKSDDLKGFKLEKDQYVNHFFQNTAITTKVGLLHTLRHLTWHQSVDVDTVFPRAYDLNEPRDMDDFVMDFRYTFAEGVLKRVARMALQAARSGALLRVNAAFADVLSSIARKKLRSKRMWATSGVGDADGDGGEGEALDPMEDSVDEQGTAGMDDLVTDLEWEVLSTCQVDAPGKLRASLVYKKRVVVDDRNDGGGDAAGVNPTVDTVTSAVEKKQQRRVERMRMDAFTSEKARLAELLTRMEPLKGNTGVGATLVALTKALALACPQFHLNGGGDWDAVLDQREVPAPSENVWIVKPAGMSRGRGIRVFNDLAALLAYADVENHKECQWVAQKYMENPLLICSRKFDIRQWVLVTSWDPLTVWFNLDCYLRFSSAEYTTHDLTDQYVHLTNNSIQKYSDKFHEVYTTADGGCHVEVEGNMLHSDAFADHLQARFGRGDVFREHMQPAMQTMIVQSLQCAQDAVQHRKNSCELYGYDFMVDATLRPWLIEVNSSPACDYSTPTAERYVQSGLQGIVQIIVDHREFEQHHQRKQRGGGGGSRSGRDGDASDEPPTGRWRRIHRGEYIGQPVTSFGADFQVQGLKVQKTRGERAARAAAAAAAAKAVTTVEEQALAEQEGDDEEDGEPNDHCAQGQDGNELGEQDDLEEQGEQCDQGDQDEHEDDPEELDDQNDRGDPDQREMNGDTRQGDREEDCRHSARDLDGADENTANNTATRSGPLETAYTVDPEPDPIAIHGDGHASDEDSFAHQSETAEHIQGTEEPESAYSETDPLL